MQMAYNQATIFLVKLLQAVSDITLAPEAQPAEFVPPWEGREKAWFTSHISMYYKVCARQFVPHFEPDLNDFI
jgi:hypothetical protein